MEEIIINIAVVEDEQQQILNYQNYLDRFQKERKITVKTHYFNDGLFFLEQYHQNEFDGYCYASNERIRDSKKTQNCG